MNSDYIISKIKNTSNYRYDSKGNYNKSKKDGEWTYYSDDGQIYVKINYKNGLKYGKSISYSPNYFFKRWLGIKQKKEAELNYKDNELDGIQTYFNDEENIEKRENYNNGNLDSIRTYYNDGPLYTEENYKNGKLDGEKSYYHSGQLESERRYKNGEIEGEYITFFKSGQIATKCNYTNGNEIERKTYYSYKGKIMMKGKTEMMYNPNASKEDYINIINLSMKVGKWTYYNDIGKIVNEIDFKHGNSYGFDRTFHYKEWYKGVSDHKGTQIKYQLLHIRGEKHQKYFKYDENGNIEKQGYYEDLTQLGAGKYYSNEDDLKKGVKFYNI